MGTFHVACFLQWVQDEITKSKTDESIRTFIPKILAGVQPMIIKEWLGHKEIKITLNTYGHLYPPEQEKVAEMLDRQWSDSVNEVYNR